MIEHLKKVMLGALAICVLTTPVMADQAKHEATGLHSSTNPYPTGSAAGTAPAKMVKAYRLSQDNAYFGATDIYLSDVGARLVTSGDKVVIVTQAPEWKVVVYSKDANKGIERSLDDWCIHGLGALNSKKPLGRGIRRPIRDSKLKLDCCEIVIHANERFYGTDDPLIFRSLNKQSLAEIRYEYSRSLTINTKVKDFLRGLYNVPDFGGVPLELVNIFNNGSKSYNYRTFWVKETTVPDSTFAYPRGYRKASNIAEIMMGNLNRGEIRDLIDSLVDEAKDAKK